jgi:hypothetical protein
MEGSLSAAVCQLLKDQFQLETELNFILTGKAGHAWSS